MARILEGKSVARDIIESVRDDINQLVTQYGSVPGLTVVKVGDDPGSTAYARAIRRSAKNVQIPFTLLELPGDMSAGDCRSTVERLNQDPDVAGVMVLQPLPRHIPKSLTAEVLDPLKDVDGVTLTSVGRLEAGVACLVPSTPQGGIEILRYYDIPVAGRHAVVVGRSQVIGKPLATMLLKLDATVTICHSRTPDLGTYTRQADIVALAAGRASLLTSDMVRSGATILDFGVNVHGAEMVGDADPAVAEVAEAMTPVPGGTGVVTNAVLMRNTLMAIKNALA
ncbi:MAG: tetrahydrofolate dehydrogenase/cyclohydrolase catalytic domain-containing protein [Nitrolancea sp.]